MNKPTPQNAINRAAFILAFVPDSPSADLAAWSACASAAIDEAELAAVYEAIEAAGLRDWLDDTLRAR